MRKQQRRNKMGFTLIELMLVLALIGVMATLVFGVAGYAKRQARQALVSAQLEKVKMGLEQYRAERGFYPRVDSGPEGKRIDQLVDALVPDDVGAAAYVEFNVSEVTNNVWLDPWGQAFVYNGWNPQRNPDSYDLYSLGPNPDDNDDDIGNW